MKLPSNKLLSKVLGEEVYGVEIVENELRWLVDEDEYAYDVINIYELMHLMKVWVTKKGFEVFSATTIDGKGVCCTVPEDCGLEEVSYHEGSYTCENTEFKAVTQACEWILKQGGSDD